MINRPKMFAAAALVTTAALVVSGCPQTKKSAPANTTDGEVIVEETVVEEEMPEEGNKEEPAAEPADEPPAPEPKADEAAPEASGKVMLGSPELTAGIAGEGPLEMAEIEVWLADPANHEPLEFELPMGLATGAGQIKGIDTNPLTRAKIELGRQLYFDPRLSAGLPRGLEAVARSIDPLDGRRRQGRIVRFKRLIHRRPRREPSEPE